MVDVAVIGAGLAGLACAQRLKQLGLQVVVLEKSRGLGGRLATRRLPKTHADHGVRCLEHQGNLTETLIHALCAKGTLHPWISTLYEVGRSSALQPSAQVQSRYAAPNGITAVAKFLANGLEIWRGQRVEALIPQADRTWTVVLESNQTDLKAESRGQRVEGERELALGTNGAESFSGLTAKAVMVAIPAPQALELLSPLAEQGLSEEFLAKLRSVQFRPCITAIASYSPIQQTELENLSWQAITLLDDPDLDWVAIDSTKQPIPPQPVVIIQSTATFAQKYLEASRDPLSLEAGQELLNRVAQYLPSSLAAPEQVQVHRWRYAFATEPLTEPYLSTLTPLPVGCGGDWCGGTNIEAALHSGLQCANQMAGYWLEVTQAESLVAVWEQMLKQIAFNL